MQVSIFYDGECPVCTNYIKYLRLKESAGAPALIDLRQDAAARGRFQADGFSVDEGMVAEIDGRVFKGGDAVHALALLTTPVGVANRLNALVFSSPFLSRILYPVLRAGRNLLLIILGREPINADDPAQLSKFALFSLIFGFFTIFHTVAYPLHYFRFPPSPDIVALGFAGLALVLHPGSKRLFLLVVALSLISGWIQAPVQSNHTILRNFLVIGFLIVFAIDMLRGASWSKMFADFAPVGGVGLLVMYFFGVFHKINSGFLDPSTSCAVELWREMLFFVPPLDIPLIHYAAIYGTYVAETTLAICLLIPRTRHLAVVGGIAFHMLLAFSNFGMYLPFTTLSIAAHLLFLTPQGAHAVMHSPMMVRYRQMLERPAPLALGLVLLGLLIWVTDEQRFDVATLLAFPLVLPVLVAVARYGWQKQTEPLLPRGTAPALVIILGGLFFANGFAPYLGLKTSQAFNMFSNLRLEGGTSNHLVFNSQPKMFGYLDDVVILEKVEGSLYLEAMIKVGKGFIYHDFLNYIENRPEIVVTYTMNGETHVDESAATLASEIDRVLVPKVFRKFFLFNLVDLSPHPKC